MLSRKRHECSICMGLNYIFSDWLMLHQLYGFKSRQLLFEFWFYGLCFIRILRNKAIATNDGMALTLYQEAACGLTAGAAEAYFSCPFVYACLPSVDPTNLSLAQRAKYSNILHALYSMTANKKVSALWTNAGPYLKTRMGTNAGMLTSYNPSHRYLRDSCGLSETRAQLGKNTLLITWIFRHY